MHHGIVIFIIILGANHDKRDYNYILNNQRNMVERAFGRLKQKFRILELLLPASKENSIKTIECCVILHNFILAKETDIPVRTSDLNGTYGKTCFRCFLCFCKRACPPVKPCVYPLFVQRKQEMLS